MKKTILPLILIFCVSLIGCSAKYKNVKTNLTKEITIQDEFIINLNQASTADDFAEALTTYGDKMTELRPKLKADYQKYPELKNPEKCPEDLQKILAKRQENNDLIGKLLANRIPKYANDQKVFKALEKILEEE